MIKFSTKQILTFVIMLLFFISGFFISKHFEKNHREAIKRELRAEKIKNDSIKKVSEGHYSKLVADTLTKKQLRDKVKELEFKIKTPISTGIIKLDFDTLKTNTEGTKKDSLIKIIDYYPTKENSFITYSAEINLYTYHTEGLFQIKSLELFSAKGIEADGTTRFEIKVPRFVTVSSLDIQTKNPYQERRSNFGYLLGGQAVLDYNTNEINVGVNFGLRYKKTYITLGTTTNKTIQTGLTFEF